MRKYIQIAKVTLEEYFVYRANFLLWRLRVFLRILVLFSLWNVLISGSRGVAGYAPGQIQTYILLTSFVASLTTFGKTADVAGQISSGQFSNLLVKPISYFKFWFARDLADKLLNVLFSIGDFIIIFLIFSPVFVINGFLNVVLFILSLTLGVVLNYLLSFIVNSITFWTPDNPWPPRFLFIVLVEFVSGGTFPLDVLPAGLGSILKTLPFAYLVHYPLQIYLGRVDVLEAFKIIAFSLLWIVGAYIFLKIVWEKGLRNYESVGR